MVIRSLCILIIAAFVTPSSTPIFAQSISAIQQPSDDSETRKATITILGGIGSPLSKAGMKEFWGSGLSGSLLVLLHVSRYTSVGVGLDIAHFPFKREAFVGSYPTIEVKETDIVGMNVLLSGKYVPAPTARLGPFFLAQVGAAQVTEADYREVVDSVRVTYYRIPKRFRLATSLATGFELFVTRGFWIQLEGKAVYVVNDPARGFITTVRIGVVIRL